MIYLFILLYIIYVYFLCRCIRASIYKLFNQLVNDRRSIDYENRNKS